MAAPPNVGSEDALTWDLNAMPTSAQASPSHRNSIAREYAKRFATPLSQDGAAE